MWATFCSIKVSAVQIVCVPIACDYCDKSSLTVCLCIVVSLHCVGHYIEKAELSIVGSSTRTINANQTKDPYSSNRSAANLFGSTFSGTGDFEAASTEASSDVYKSCLNFEVKVMECVESAAGSDSYAADRTSSSSPVNVSGTGNASNRSASREQVRVEQCVVCVGVLQHSHRMTEHATPHSEDHILNPTLLTSGRYEVLLYTVYSPDTDLDVTLVGRIVVQLMVPELMLALPVVPLSEPLPFDIARYQAKKGEAAFVYWAECVVRCCDSLAAVDDAAQRVLFNTSAAFDPTSTFNTTGTGDANLSSTAASARDVQRRREELQSELQTLLCVLTLPQYAEHATHDAVVAWLSHTDPQRFGHRILSELHTFFQVSVNYDMMVSCIVII